MSVLPGVQGGTRMTEPVLGPWLLPGQRQGPEGLNDKLEAGTELGAGLLPLHTSPIFVLRAYPLCA